MKPLGWTYVHNSLRGVQGRNNYSRLFGAYNVLFKVAKGYEWLDLDCYLGAYATIYSLKTIARSTKKIPVNWTRTFYDFNFQSKGVGRSNAGMELLLAMIEEELSAK